jgi:hypothetical protein
MNKKRLIITSSISIILVAILLIGSTYSVFTSSEIDENTNVYKTGNLDVTYTLSKDNVSFSNTTPMTEEEADSITPYSITVTNSGTVPYMFDVILTETTASNAVDSKYIMTKIGYTTPKKLAECTDNKIREDIIVPAGESVDIDVRVWLSDEVKNKINKLDIRVVIDFRNRLVHGYGNIDYKIVYNTIKNSLPSLISQLSDYFITEYNCNITKINESV